MKKAGEIDSIPDHENEEAGELKKSWNRIQERETKVSVISFGKRETAPVGIMAFSTKRKIPGRGASLSKEGLMPCGGGYGTATASRALGGKTIRLAHPYRKGGTGQIEGRKRRGGREIKGGESHGCVTNQGKSACRWI